MSINPAFMPSTGGGGGGGAPSLLNDIVAYWKLEEASGNRDDAIGTLDFVPTNTPNNAAGIIDMGLNLVGASSQQVSVAHNAALACGDREWTFDFWIKPTSVSSGIQFILHKGTDTSGANLEVVLFLNNANLQARVAVGATTTTLTIGVIAVGVWHYIALWFDPTNNSLAGQINWNGPVSAPVIGAPNTGAAALRLGTWSGGTSYYTGVIDEMGRWNRILTGDERATRYNLGAGNTYPFSSPSRDGTELVGTSPATVTYSSSIEA